MEEAMSTPSSPRCDNGWTLVERPAAGGTSKYSDSRPPSSSPNSELAVEQPSEHDKVHDGLKSPESERLADDLLREPFQASARGPSLQLATPPPTSTIEEPSTPTAPSGPYAPSSGDLTAYHPHHASVNKQQPDFAAAAAAALAALANAHAGGGGNADSSGGGGVWSFERQRERLRAVSRLSGEGALEGFQDPQDLLLADAAPAGAGERQIDTAASTCSPHPSSDHHGEAPPGPPLSLGWDALLSSALSDLVREWEDLQARVAATAAALWERVREGRLAVEEWAAAVRAAAHQAAKTASSRSCGCPWWAPMGVSSLAALAALAALAMQLAVNKKLAATLRARDQDLARLMVKVFNLHDALQSATRDLSRDLTPLVVSRLTPLDHRCIATTTTTTTLIGMV